MQVNISYGIEMHISFVSKVILELVDKYYIVAFKHWNSIFVIKFNLFLRLLQGK